MAQRLHHFFHRGFGGNREIPPETPVKQVMEALRGGAEALAVVDGGQRLGVIRSADVMGKLLDPRG